MSRTTPSRPLPTRPGHRTGRAPGRARAGRLAALLLLAGLATSCAYYNTFYLARKYYMKATDGQPYEVDREGSTQRSNYTKSGDYAKKLLGVYPRSKWVDDAWLLWAKTFVGTDDPLKAVAMLEEFQTKFPKSDLRPDAEFFLGLAYRAAHKNEPSVAAFDEFLAQAPKHVLAPYAWYERSKALMSLQRYQEAARSAGEVLKRWPRHALTARALRQRAEARYQQQDYAGARADFREIGAQALSDVERMTFLLREVDCLEASRDYETARALLRDARSHVLPPPPLPVAPRVTTTTAAGSAAPPPAPVSYTRTPAQEVYGRLTLRMGGVEVLSGHVDTAVELYRTVLADYPRSQLAAEAQYRIGLAYETGADDFARARAEYARVREQTGTSQFTQQAQQRLDNLDRIERFRTAGGADSLERKAEARFLTAEHYLFNLDRPERALEEYRAIFDSTDIAPVKARALNAEAWVLSRKLDRKPQADSLFWAVVHGYPATEAQLAARDYLEAEGQMVPESLIVAPKEPVRPLLDADTTLTRPPSGTPRLGERALPGLAQAGPSRLGPGAPPAGASDSLRWRNTLLVDSLRRNVAHRDSLLRMALRDTSRAGRARVDSLRRAFAHPDTAGRGALMADIQRRIGRADSVVVAPGQGHAPNLSDTTRALPGATATAPVRSVLPPAARVDMPPPAAQQPDSGRAAARADSLARAAEAARASAGSDSAATRAMAAPKPAAADSTPRTRSVYRSLFPDSTAVRPVFRRTGTESAPASPPRPRPAPAGQAPAGPAAASPAPASPAPERPLTSSHSITSTWERTTPAERDSLRRVKARTDSLRRAHADSIRAARAARKAADKAAKQAAKSRPPAASPAKPGPAAPDTTRRPAQPGPAAPDTTRRPAQPAPAAPDTARGQTKPTPAAPDTARSPRP